MADVFDELEPDDDSIGEEIGSAVAYAIAEINNSNDSLIRRMVDVLAANNNEQKLAEMFKDLINEINENNKKLTESILKQQK